MSCFSPRGLEGEEAAVWDGAGGDQTQEPPASTPPSPALPVRERRVRSDPKRRGYKGDGPSGAPAQPTRQFSAAAEYPPPNFGEEKGLVGEGAEPRPGEPGTFLGPGGSLNDPSGAG
ncbi:hypothetical protein H8959_017805 [Pygathrix nigripes]